MDKLGTRELAHIAGLIEKEVSYFNGWSVSQEQVEDDCFKAACRISKYLDAKQRRAIKNASLEQNPKG